MAIKIGHASIDERGRISGGASGDQSGKELCIREWYNKKWDFVLRPKHKDIAEKSARAVEQACANPNIGYDQGQRNTLYKQAALNIFDLSAVRVKCECDCSSLMHVCAIAGGANLSYGTNGFTTSTMGTYFVRSGDYDKLTDSKYRTSDKYLKRGDILVKAGSHTVMVLEDGSYATATVDKAIATTSTYSRTQFIRDVQACVGAAVDGIAGNETLSKTVTISALKNRKHPVVKYVQKYLNSLGYNCGTPDGIAGAKFTWALRNYQKANGCVADGEITARGKTWKKLLGMM